jgi:hypothetical protein
VRVGIGCTISIGSNNHKLHDRADFGRLVDLCWLFTGSLTAMAMLANLLF